MIEDAAARSHLDAVVRDWRAEGPLDALCALIAEVWQANRDRQDPKLGDDAQLLGLQCHRNILNRAKLLITKISEAEVEGAQTLEVHFGGKTMHTSKITSRDAAWNPYLMKWDDSPVRQRSARGNSEVYAPSEDTLFASLSDGAPSAFGANVVEALPFLHLAWQGLNEGGIRVFVGFPQLGPSPWLAVTEISIGRPGIGGVPLPAHPSPVVSPDHDALAEPEVAVKRRRPSEQEEAPDSGSSSA